MSEIWTAFDSLLLSGTIFLVVVFVAAIVFGQFDK